MKATLPCKGGGGHLNPHFLSKVSKLREVSLFNLVDLESDSRFQTLFLSIRCSKPTKKAELRGTMPSGRQNAAEVCSNKASPNSIMFARLQCNKTIQNFMLVLAAVEFSTVDLGGFGEP